MSGFPEHFTLNAYDLLDAFGQDGCPICGLALRSVAHYMEAMNYDSVGDQDFRSQLRKSMGFCNLHAHQWLDTAFILGTAEIYRDVLNDLIARLREETWQPGDFADHLLSWFSHRQFDQTENILAFPTASCPACEQLAETESMLIRTLISEWDTPAFRDAYLASSGLCIPHLRMAWAAAPSSSIRKNLRDHALKVEERMLGQLEEVIRKHDYRYQHEPAGKEKGAAQRVVQHVAGQDRIVKLQIIQRASHP